MMYIDNVQFARAARKISGKLDLTELPRVQEIDNYSGELNYSLEGSTDNMNRPVLQLSMCGIIDALCQNCLQEMQIEVNNQSRIAVFNTEEQLDAALFATEDAEVEDGVLADNEFDVMQFLEDEVIMLLPYSSRHEKCIGLAYHDDVANPFSVLKNIV